ncbi:unnamed protein product [Rotaria sp. Silwood1]|nr:unnamed protein product [Rotaria sp. Silwood1]CAF1631959.1 unnamed protein product [Rotaria sp. Silwood1]
MDNRLYAVKRSLILFHDETHRNKKLKEINFHQKILTHTNILKLIRSWEEQGSLYIQTELCEMDLFQYSQDNRMNDLMIWSLIYQICQALICLHSLLFVHMNIKPKKILITSSSIYKLSDFSRIYNVRYPPTVIENDNTRYLPLEVNHGLITTAVDIFSLGLMLVELISKNTYSTLPDDTWNEIHQAKLPPNITDFMDVELKNILLQMINPEYQQRPSACSLLNNLIVKEKVRT